MSFTDRINLITLLDLLSIELHSKAESTNTEVDETLDEAIRTLIHYLD